jgi:hypothetical protein
MTPSQNVGQLCRDLESAVREYAQQAEKSAQAESDYKRYRAKRILRAKAEEGVKAISEAEYVADADDAVADLRQAHLIATAIAESTKHRIGMLKERIGLGRSLIASEREADKFHASHGAA